MYRSDRIIQRLNSTYIDRRYIAVARLVWVIPAPDDCEDHHQKIEVSKRDKYEDMVQIEQLCEIK